MKKKLIILLTLLSTFIVFDNVKAASLYPGQKFNRVGDYRSENNGITDNNKDTDFLIDNFLYRGTTSISFTDYLFNYDVDGKSTTAYCLDPSYSNPTSVKVNRVLKSNASDSTIDSYDYGMYEILDKGYHESNTNYSFTFEGQTYSISNKDFEIATLIAIRSFNIGIFNNHAKDPNKSSKMSAVSKGNALIRTSLYAKAGIKWGAELGGLTIKASSQCAYSKDSLITCLSKNVTNKFGNLQDVELNPGDSKGTDNWKIYYAARDLFGKGIKAAAEYVEGTSSAPSVDVRQGSLKKVSSNNNDVLNAEERTIEFKIKNFSKDGYVKNIKVICEDCNEKGVTISNYEYYNTSTKKWLPFNPNGNNINLANNIDTAGVAKIKFRTQRTNPNDESCESANFQVIFDEYDPSQKTIAAELVSSGSTNKSDNAQKVLMLVDNKSTSRTFSGIINCSKAKCPTKIENPDCDTDGYANVIAPEDIKTCILDNSDDAGNSYQLTSENGGISNRYCNIFCKEDYIDVFSRDNDKKAGIQLNPKLAGKDGVVCGQDFKLAAHIEGKKDCYTGGTASDSSINRQRMIDDINAVLEEMIEAYNAVRKAEAALSHIERALSGGAKSFTPYTDPRVGWYSKIETVDCSYIDKETGETIPCSRCEQVATCQIYHVYGKASGAYANGYDANGILRISFGPDIVDYEYGGRGKDGGYSSACDAGNCKNGDPEVLKENIINDLEKNTWIKGHAGDKVTAATSGYWAEKGLNLVVDDITNKIKGIIAEYNSCTNGWSMDFPFDQKIGFDTIEYQESKKTEGNQFKYTNLLKPNQKYLTRLDDTLKEEKEIEYCYGNIDNEYNCLGRSTNNASDISTTRLRFRICNSNGCNAIMEEYVSDVRYVRQTIKKGVDYITPSVFYQVYPTGAITAKNDYYGNSIQLKLLENSIPVSLSNYGGGIFKLQISQLGEFYDTGELGRLIDFGGNNESRSVATALEDNKTSTSEKVFDGNYVCNYESKCPSNVPPCPNCKFECEGENCELIDCPECNIICENCLFSYDKLQLNFKSVSTTNFLTGNREYGFNWAINTNIKLLDLIAAKANTTIEEIKKANTTIFNGENVDTVSKDMSESNLEFSIKLTPKMIKDIRDYNDNVEQYGGYANDSLTCYDYKIGDKTYSNLLCYSDFLDDLFREYEGEGLIVAPRRATTASDIESTISARKNNPNNDSNNQRGYWTLWTQITDYKEELANGSVIGGPAWK